jgi:hypothetical protein
MKARTTTNHENTLITLGNNRQQRCKGDDHGTRELQPHRQPTIRAEIQEISLLVRIQQPVVASSEPLFPLEGADCGQTVQSFTIAATTKTQIMPPQGIRIRVTYGT